MSIPTNEVTQLLLAWEQGDQAALDQLVPLVHKELHRLARHYMHLERPGHVLQTTALINEAFLRLADSKSMKWQSRAHFLGVAAHLMRQVLVDYARARNRGKRGAGWEQISLDDAAPLSPDNSSHFIAIDQALQRLAVFDSLASQIVELRYFGGLSWEEVSEVVGKPLRTVERKWSVARDWLHKELQGIEPHT